MKYGSVCSGIESATVAWHSLGWTPSWFAEIEPFPCSVLAHHYPHVPNLGDMTKIKKSILHGRVEAPDIFCAGQPLSERLCLSDAPSQNGVRFREFSLKRCYTMLLS